MLNLAAAASTFRDVLLDARRRIGPPFEWYPYDSLANAARVDRLLAGRSGEVLGDGAASRVLDIGCGDGDMAFLLESLGFSVTALDHVSSNHNGMRGVRALKAQLGSAVALAEADIDTQFQLPAGRFRLALFLGLLYHLKNPFYALERLAKSCDYCVLSTRIASRLPDGLPMAPEHPLAYLLAADELNADDSNFWIFNETGLRRLLARTHWEVLEYFTTGDSAVSDPVRNDERAFCLLRSRYGATSVELVSGWHEPEESGWRWTSREFTVACQGAGTRLRVRGYVPEALLTAGPLRLSMDVDGVALRAEWIDEAGELVIERKVGRAASHIAFSLNRSIAASESDPRELGLIIAGIELE